MPDSTALAPAVRSTTIDTDPGEVSEIGKISQAPPLKLLDRAAV